MFPRTGRGTCCVCVLWRKTWKADYMWKNKIYGLVTSQLTHHMPLFKTNTCWCVHSMQKNGFSLHRRPSFHQKLPGDFEKLVAFQWHVDIKRWTIISWAKQQTLLANQHTLIGCQFMSVILGQHLWLLKHISHLFIRKYVSKHHVGISVDGRMLLPYGILKFNGTKLLPYVILKWKAMP